MGGAALLLSLPVYAQEERKTDFTLAAAYLHEKGDPTTLKGWYCDSFLSSSFSGFGAVTICYTQSGTKEKDDDALLVKIGDIVSYTDEHLEGRIDKLTLGTSGPEVGYKWYSMLDKQAVQAHQKAYVSIIKEYVRMKIRE